MRNTQGQALTRNIDDHATELTAAGKAELAAARRQHDSMGLRDDTTADSTAEMAAIQAGIDRVREQAATATEMVLTLDEIKAHGIRNNRAAKWMDDLDDGTERYMVPAAVAAEIAAAR